MTLPFQVSRRRQHGFSGACVGRISRRRGTLHDVVQLVGYLPDFVIVEVGLIPLRFFGFLLLLLLLL